MFDELLDRFINFLRVEKGLSPNTLESYSRDLIGYLRFLEARGSPRFRRPRPTPCMNT